MEIIVSEEVKVKVLSRLLFRLNALKDLKVDDVLEMYRFSLGGHIYVMDPRGVTLWIKKGFDSLEIEMTESEKIFDLMYQIYQLIDLFAQCRNKAEITSEFLDGLL